jgi:hypothetical protein
VSIRTGGVALLIAADCNHHSEQRDHDGDDRYNDQPLLHKLLRRL